MHHHLLWIQDKCFDFTIDAYANKLNDECGQIYEKDRDKNYSFNLKDL